VPKKSENATGDALETDGKIAVLIWATMDADKKPN
jgi:hypothetical protein